MSNPILSKCPVCGRAMQVTRLFCSNCKTTVEGGFDSCKFCRLDEEQRKFVEMFLTSRGNIKEVERLLGISYPTVRSRLDAIIEALGYRVEREEDQRRKEILEAVNKGEISSEEAVRLLRN